jgi:hypothetical protein
MTKSQTIKYIQRHKDGSVWARGQTIDAIPIGYWQGFRKDGVRRGRFRRPPHRGDGSNTRINAHVRRRRLPVQAAFPHRCERRAQTARASKGWRN